jgi:hypothetical protein
MLNNHLVFVFIFLLPPSLNNTTQTKNKKRYFVFWISTNWSYAIHRFEYDRSIFRDVNLHLLIEILAKIIYLELLARGFFPGETGMEKNVHSILLWTFRGSGKHPCPVVFPTRPYYLFVYFCWIIVLIF